MTCIRWRSPQSNFTLGNSISVLLQAEKRTQEKVALQKSGNKAAEAARAIRSRITIRKGNNLSAAACKQAGRFKCDHGLKLRLVANSQMLISPSQVISIFCKVKSVLHC